MEDRRVGNRGVESGNQFYDPDMNRATDTPEDVQALASRVNEVKLMTKIDFRLIPVLTIMYLLACELYL